uniref:Uncharacterized protein n=1 Tax=Nelumbo nucifera TaxID=4432 RepID=A0A822ZUD1_NELNU|nr:TPA_asm: hypothetical protein HUJ06_017068 [Nelumbo nucifera]
MKNVAKCDTWCELQNPVNHRVFERKLRPRAFEPRARLPGRQASLPFPPFPIWCWRVGADVGLSFRFGAVGQMMAPDNKVPRRLVVQS